MHAIALNVTHLPVVVTKLGTMRICGVEIIERPMVLESLRMTDDCQLFCHLLSLLLRLNVNAYCIGGRSEMTRIKNGPPE
jgi:hypothetical protein